MTRVRAMRFGVRSVAARGLTCALLFAGALAARPQVRAHGSEERVDRDAMAKIRGEALERSQVVDTVLYLTDVCGPRLTGSPSLRAADEWCAARLRAWGLSNVHLEPWGPFGRGWSLEGFVANTAAPAFGPLIAYPRAWSPSTDGVVRGDAVYVDVRTPADLARYRGKLRGAIVLLGLPREPYSRDEPVEGRRSDEDLLELANAGTGDEHVDAGLSPAQRAEVELAVARWRLVYDERPAVVLTPGLGEGGTFYVTDETIAGPSGSSPDTWPHPWAANAPAAIPQAVVAAEHYNRIVRLLARGVRVRLEVGITSRFYDDDPMSYNVVGEIPGTDLANEVVMLGGCLDSWHADTGATDNAAGAAVCLEAVRVLEAAGLRPRRTIRVALWSGEEQGTLGSSAYVAEHFGVRHGASEAIERKAEYDRLSCYFNLDYGTGKIRGVFLQGNEAVRPIFRAWLEPFADLGASTLSLASVGSTDHVPFDDIGLPAFQFIRDELGYDRTQHTNMDVYERVAPKDLEQAAAVVAGFVYDAAMRDERLPRRSK